ncbi:MAG: DUF3775 domain-containing protein [Bauldia sp.]
MKKPSRAADPQDTAVELTIPLDKVCHLIAKAREFDVKDEVTDAEPEASPDNEEEEATLLESYADDPLVGEITTLIDDLSVDQQIDLVAIAWLGRGDYTAADWPSVRGEATDAHNPNTANYLLGMPLLGDYLEEGLALLGRGCEEYDETRP